MCVCVFAPVCVQVCMRRLAAGYFCFTHWWCSLCVSLRCGAEEFSPECVECTQVTSALLRPRDRGFDLQRRKMRV